MSASSAYQRGRANLDDLNKSYNVGSNAILIEKQQSGLPDNTNRNEWKNPSEMSRYGKETKTRTSVYSKSKRESQGSGRSDGSSNHSHRVTPYELRRPFVVFTDDANAVEDLRYRRQRLQEVEGGRESTMYNTNVSSIVREVAELKKNRRSRKDCYSMILDERSRNPFMTKILKSSDFSP